MAFPISLILTCAAGVWAAPSASGGADSQYKITPDVIYGHKAGMALTFDVVHPQEPNGAGVLFMMSGAWHSHWVPPESFFAPDASARGQHFSRLVDRGYTLFIVRHGSAPHFKVPDAVADVRRAVRYIHQNAEKFGVDPERLGVCGGSAGGHLSLMLGTTGGPPGAEGNGEAPQEEAGPRVAAVVAFFPPVDLREWVGDERFAALHFDPERAPAVSPLLHVSPDDAPTLLVHGDQDELVKLDNSDRMMAAFEKHQVPCKLIVIEGAGHGFGGPVAERASKALIEWFDKHLAADVEGEDSRQENQ